MLTMLIFDTYSKEPNKVGVSLLSPEDGKKSSFLNVVF
jgi:hypothetical protein